MEINSIHMRPCRSYIALTEVMGRGYSLYSLRPRTTLEREFTRLEESILILQQSGLLG